MIKAYSTEFFIEVYRGFSDRRIWMRLAKMAIDTQYKQNTLGPLWIAANTAVLVTAFALVYSQILNVSLDGHLLYVASGLVCWYFYSSILLKGCSIFIVSRQLILQLPLPISVHIYKLIYQELLIFTYNLIVLLVICLLFKRSIGIEILLIFPAFLLILINAFFSAFLLAIIATRYRDVTSTVQAFISPMMFLTPIIWSAETLIQRPAFITFNPFFHLIEIWRSPIIGTPVPISSWVFMCLFTSFIVFACYSLYSRYNARISFWL